LTFNSPGWSEFATGETRLASEKNPPGTVELGFGVPDLQKLLEEMSAKDVSFSMPPTKQDSAGMLSQFVDSEGGHITVSPA
jgi:predicted enzyme related to lactoylglutathione lyase